VYVCVGVCGLVCVHMCVQVLVDRYMYTCVCVYLCVCVGVDGQVEKGMCGPSGVHWWKSGVHTSHGSRDRCVLPDPVQYSIMFRRSITFSERH